MANDTSIEWTRRPGTIGCTWQVTCGCLHHSIGCGNCYAEFMAWRLANMAQADLAGGRDPGRKRHYLDVIDMDKRRWNGRIMPVPEALNDPLPWKKPRTVFVDSMSDLFYGDERDAQECERRGIPFKPVPFEFIDKVFAVMGYRKAHTFIVLTKRAQRMSEYFSLRSWSDLCVSVVQEFDAMPLKVPAPEWLSRFHTLYRVTEQESARGTDWPGRLPLEWPLPNVWLGTSQENQQQANERTKWLRQCPAAVRLVSYEPALGPIDGFKAGWWSQGESEFAWEPHIDQLIMGCESRGANVGRLGEFKNENIYREHAEFQVACCANAGVAMFQKQVPIEGKVSHDPTEWPEELRIREFPARHIGAST